MSVVPGKVHNSGLGDSRPQTLRPVLPCCREAFLRPTAWVRRRPTASRTVAGPASGDLATTCAELAEAPPTR